MNVLKQNGFRTVRDRLRHLRWLLLVLLGAIASVLLVTPRLPAAPSSLPPSQYASTIQAPFNQPSYYAIAATPPAATYKPVAPWVGRLILPTVEQYQQTQSQTKETDWAWFEVYVAPPEAKQLIGQTVRLAWQQEPAIQAYVKVASRDVTFVPSAEQAFQNGVINPIRLNGRTQVGPLQSLAGGHPYDDVTVALKGKVKLEMAATSPTAPTTTAQTSTVLRVQREPIQETGQYSALVKLIEPVSPKDPKELPPSCPGEAPCSSDRFRVQHYNPTTRQFDGVQEVIRIPQQPADKDGIFNTSTRNLEKAIAGSAGWYIYGAKDQTGLFTVQAMKPRALFQIDPQRVILDFKQGLRFIDFDNWKDVESRKGEIQTTLIDTTSDTSNAVRSNWKTGSWFLVIHNYGGRGGTHPKHESFVAGTYAGHFSFGVGAVINDPFTNEPVFDYDYFQVYGNGGDGTLSGGQSWANYMGNLRRGFISMRPISDTLIHLDTLTEDHQFGDTKLSFFKELIAELSLIGARYRIGDGSGDSTITSATSCVQDSAQALFLTLRRFQEKIETNPQILAWMKAHPDDSNTQRFRRLVKLGKDLAEQLTPVGIVRWDWEQNAEQLTGLYKSNQFLSIDDFQPKNLITGLISWRTAMPRQAHDEFAKLFLHHGAKIWVLRPNQIGGTDPGVAPLEPTLLLGAWKLPLTSIPLAAYLVIRTFGGFTFPTSFSWLITFSILAALAAIALPFGFATRFFHWKPQHPWHRQLGTLLRLFFVPALLQEYLFRILLIPYPVVWLPALTWWAWALLALGLFVGFQWLYARWRLTAWYQSVSSETFLTLMTLLGFACTLTYRLTASLATITVLHWLAISAWWLLLGGKQQSHWAKTKSV
ncbi:MAG TPA: CPBP family intramembrane metalloprotease domain-containing protein [Leptolyngbyaceae cyanobacterium M33_DOE_097]|uniref:CPBP family intramembrane metalloprotease domain-containing protein n=1 Tax=Oscillatoriales cyanobacterium SpSt-418 TaxID=2282169 RepID=A0A7C3KDZ6_9CYAN|nr:CPBP family intramembrane metalloprotease domain-containing protein [Leptolyngbyaceae cyanobacterium M33_DOE_097]